MNKKLKFTLLLLVCFVAVFLLLNSTKIKHDETRAVNAQISGEHFSLQIAETNTQRKLGLSVFVEIDKREGMLFVFDNPDYHSIWMKDMNFAIDILWLNEKREIVHIEQNVLPESFPAIFTPIKPALYVIEVSSNTVQDINLKVGDVVYW